MKHGLHWNVFICRSLQYLKAPDTTQNKLHFLAPVWLLGCYRNQGKDKPQDHVYLEIITLKCMTVTESRTDSISLSILLWQKALIQAMWTSCSILGMPSKKITEKETLVHSHLSPSPPSLNGTTGIGTQKIVHWPPPPFWQ